jgi:hypothetical protein
MKSFLDVYLLIILLLSKYYEFIPFIVTLNILIAYQLFEILLHQ